MGFLKKLLGGSTGPNTMEATLLGGTQPLEVKGEASYQEALWQVVEKFGREVRAVLSPEPNNPYDANAVAVKVAGLTVGFLKRDDAATYRPGIVRLQKELGNPIALTGRIVGGDSGRESLGIWLRHDPTDFGLPGRHIEHPAHTDERNAGGVWTGTGAGTLTWMSGLPADRLAAIAFLREHLATEADAVERHFLFNELEVHLYKSRDAFSSALVEYEETCVQHDSEMSAIRPLLISALGGVPYLPTYKQVAIMKHKARDFEMALWWAQRGLELYGEECVREDVVRDLRERTETYRAKLNG